MIDPNRKITVHHIGDEHKELLYKLAEEHGTPLFIVDHQQIEKQYSEFTTRLPNVQAYYAVKANPDPEIIKTLFDAGASFDVSTMKEFNLVYENIKDMPEKERLDWIKNNIIVANTIKPIEMLEELDKYGPLLTFDNAEELKKIKAHAPHSGLILRIRVPNTGSLSELSSKFGAEPSNAVNLITEAYVMGLTVEGLSFHVGSQCVNFENYIVALEMCSGILKEYYARTGQKMRILDIGGGFPVKYDNSVKSIRALAVLFNEELKRLFPPDILVIAEPGRFIVANACVLVSKVIGKAVRDGKTCYYINDGIYGTYSGLVFDHISYPILSFKDSEETKLSSVFGPTCDAFDTLTLSAELPDLRIGDFVYTENIGAYSSASATLFNGCEPAKVLHININRRSID